MARNYGIDLGTTNTVVCKFESYKVIAQINGIYPPEEIPIVYPEELSCGYYNVNNAKSLPSLVYLEEDRKNPGEYIHYIGEVAERLSERPENTNDSLFINTKRLMSKSEDLGYGLQARDIAKDLYSICFYSANQKQRNGMSLPFSQSFCVTRPAAYNPFATVATVDVAKEFGYSNVSSLEEPAAAMLNYLYTLLENEVTEKQLLDRQRKKSGHLVFCIIDIGGGTTDVKIQRFSISGNREIDGDEFATGYVVTFDNEEIDGKQSMSNPYEAFGGLDFDREAARYIIQKLDLELSRKYNIKFEQLSPNQKSNINSRAMHQAKVFKEHMTGNHIGIWDVPVEFTGVGNSIRVEWNEKEYNRWVAHLCISSDSEDCFDIHKLSVHSIIENTFKRSNYSAEDLDCLFVTGGMSYYGPIREMLKREYGDKVELEFSKTPLEDIARGAALYNAYFRIDVPLVTLNEGIMLDNPCGEPIIIAPSGHQLPYSKDFKNQLVITNPIEMHIDILSGVSIFDSNMRMIKRLWARKLEPTRVGTPVDIHVEITEEPRINMTLHVQQEENDYEIPIDSDKYNIDIE